MSSVTNSRLRSCNVKTVNRHAYNELVKVTYPQDELLRAEPSGVASLIDDGDDEDNVDADFDRRTLSTIGTRESQSGYLAHGGGGGAPAYVDNGGMNVGGSRISDWRARVRERMSQSQLQTHRQSSSRQPLKKESRSSRRQ